MGYIIIDLFCLIIDSSTFIKQGTVLSSLPLILSLYTTQGLKEDNYKQCLKNGSVNVNLYNKLITTKW